MRRNSFLSIWSFGSHWSVCAVRLNDICEEELVRVIADYETFDDARCAVADMNSLLDFCCNFGIPEKLPINQTNNP